MAAAGHEEEEEEEGEMGSGKWRQMFLPPLHPPSCPTRTPLVVAFLSKQ